MSTITNLKNIINSANSELGMFRMRATFDIAQYAFEKFERIQDELEEHDSTEANNCIQYIGAFDEEEARALKLFADDRRNHATQESTNPIRVDQPKIQLPTINLSTFDGTIEKWT